MGKNLGICNAINSSPPPLPMGDTCRDPHRKPESADCTEPCVFYVSPISTYKSGTARDE